MFKNIFKNFKWTNQKKILKKKNHKTKTDIFFKAFKRTWVEFTQSTSIHGLRYTTDIDQHIFWRIVWSILAFVLFCLANQLVATFYGDFINNPTRVNIDTVNAKLPNLGFPAVTICSTEVISYVVARDFANSLKLPKNVTNMTALNTIYQAVGMDLKVNYNESVLLDLQDLMESNRYTVPDFMTNLRQKCEDILIKCRFRMKIVACHKIFSPSKTFFGQCCSFNIKQDGIRFNNILATEPGISGGLSVILSPIADTRVISQFESRGFQLIIHRNDVFPTQINDPKLIGIGLETFIGIRPQEIICSNQVKQLSVSDRGCVFRNERPLEFFPEYDASNCLVECMINNVLQNCGCSPYFFGTAGSHQICNFSKVPCLVENYDLNFAEEGSSFFKCSCLPNCVDVTYSKSISQVPLAKLSDVVEPFYSDMKDNSNNTVIHIYMDSQTYTRFRRDLLYNIINLISNFGSAYSLFLGVSTVSIIELIYFFTFVLRRNYLELFDCHVKVTAFLKVVEKPNLKKIKYDNNGSVLEIKTIDESQFHADKKEMDSIHIEDIIEKEFNFAIKKVEREEKSNKTDENDIKDNNESNQDIQFYI